MYTLPFFNPIDQLNPFLRVDFCCGRVCAVSENADTQFFIMIVVCLIALFHRLSPLSTVAIRYETMQVRYSNNHCV